MSPPYFGADAFTTAASPPVLVEPGFKYFLHHTLKQCHTFKQQYFNTMLNGALLVAVLVGGVLLLWYKYKGKPTPEELARRETDKRHYILSKIKNFQDAKRIAHQELITGLPEWQNEYDVAARNVT